MKNLSFPKILPKKKLAQEIKTCSLLQGHFILRSGQSSTLYFDKYAFETKPLLLYSICYHLKALIPQHTHILAGLETGGIPLASTLSVLTLLPCLFVRKKAKTYGTKKLAEGPKIINKNLLIIEDVVSTGGQIVHSVRQLRKQGANIKKVICVIYRGQNLKGPKQCTELGLDFTPLYHFPTV